MRRWLMAVAALLLVSCGGDDTVATTTEQLGRGYMVLHDHPDLRELAGRSDVVLVGEVTGVEEDVGIGFVEGFDPDDRGIADLAQIYTLTEVRVDDVLLGQLDVDSVSVAEFTHMDGSPVPGARVLANIAVGEVGLWFLTELPEELDTDALGITDHNTVVVVTDHGLQGRSGISP